MFNVVNGAFTLMADVRSALVEKMLISMADGTSVFFFRGKPGLIHGESSVSRLYYGNL